MDNTKKQNKFFLHKKIMWIEDDEFFSALMTKRLSETGCTLVFISTGEEAIKIVGEENPDLIILDVLLPGIGGFKVLESIRADERLKTTPVMILSNSGGQENIDKAFALGVEKYFIKTSISFQDIIKEIETILRRKE